MGGSPYICISLEAFNDLLEEWDQESKQKLADTLCQRTERLEFMVTKSVRDWETKNV